MIDFQFQKIGKVDPRMRDLFRLRYQVYCTECGFESPDDHPGGLESDEYDEYSSHFCAMVIGTGEIIGTVRIILPSPIGLPIERHCQLNPDRPVINSAYAGEISRLAISKEFRRREIDKAIYSQKDVDLTEVRRVHEERRRVESFIVAGLFQCIAQESRALKLTHWYAVMVKGLCSLLRRWGVWGQSIGPEVEYHGLRGPYLFTIAEVEQHTTPQLLEKPMGWLG